MKFIKNSILIIVGVFVLYSCSNNDDVSPQINCQLTSINSGWEILYDDNGNILKILTSDQNDITFDYNDKNQITRRHSADNAIDEIYDYNDDGQLIKAISLGFGGYFLKKDMTYNNDGKIATIIDSYKYSGSPSFIPQDKYEYEWDSRGNIVEVHEYRSLDGGISYDFIGSGIGEYDDKHNIALASNVLLDGFRIDYFCQNNIIKSYDKDKDGNISSEMDYIFEYNDQGLPIKRTVTYPDITLIWEFSYDCN